MKHLIRFLLGLLGAAIVFLISGGIASVILAILAGFVWILAKDQLPREMLRWAFLTALALPCILGIYFLGIAIQEPRRKEDG